MKTLLSRALAAVGEQVLKILLDRAALWVGPLLVLVGPSVYLLWHSGVAFFQSPYPTPVWLLTAFGSIGLLLLLVIARQRARIIRLNRRVTDTFLFRGLEWKITNDFWANFEHLVVGDMDPLFRAKLLRGPFCPKCKMDASYGALTDGRCARQDAEFDVADLRAQYAAHDDFMDQLRAQTYIEAQAQARRGEIARPRQRL